MSVTEKLTKSNYLLWHAQIMSAICVAQLQGFLDSTEKQPSKTITKIVDGAAITETNPTHIQWVAQDQSVLGYILVSLSREVLTGVATLTTSAEVWSTVVSMYASRTCAHFVQMCIAFSTFKKGTQSVVEFYSKMRG
jgi:hypothetical protein